MKQRIYMFACNYNRCTNTFNDWGYADKIEKTVQKKLNGQRIKIIFNSYPFFFDGKTKNYETYINIGVETTTGAIAKQIMRAIYMQYMVNASEMKNNPSIELLHLFNQLSIEGFDIDAENGIIDNIFIGS